MIDLERRAGPDDLRQFWQSKGFLFKGDFYSKGSWSQFLLFKASLWQMCEESIEG